MYHTFKIIVEKSLFINKKPNQIIVIDVGGTHVSGGIIIPESTDIRIDAFRSLPLNANDNASIIIGIWTDLIKSIIFDNKLTHPFCIGIAMPGPFDYEKGISKISGLAKYDSLFGLNVKQALISGLNLTPDDQIVFLNDAVSYILGEYWFGKNKKTENVLGITLGTGFGSVYLKRGVPVNNRSGVPENGYLFSEPFRDGSAEDHFSTRWFLRKFRESTGKEVNGVQEMIDLGLPAAKKIFYEFADNLGTFLKPYLINFEADNLIIGGNIAKAHYLFLQKLKNIIRKSVHDIEISVSEFWDKAPLLGASVLFYPPFIDHLKIIEGPSHLDHLRKKNQSFDVIESSQWRKSGQRLLPEKKPVTKAGEYDLYPSFQIENDRINHGLDSIVNWMINKKKVIIDGYGGIFWDYLMKEMDNHFREKEINVHWYDVSVALKPEKEIRDMTQSSMGDESSIFGKRFDGTLIDFFSKDCLTKFKPDPNADMNIIIGSGASLCGWDASVIYIDLPKNEYQYRMRSGNITNLGSNTPEEPAAMYKRAYFIDWIALNRHKKEILPQIDAIVDGQKPGQIVWMEGEIFRKTLKLISTNYFRVRPWFEPGIWGGQWMKKHIPALPQDEINYAWSFEMIVPENGIILESDNRLLEFSFDFLMFEQSENILGKAYPVFKDEFPIRFDFLDTFDGDNLSVQCHPRPGYIRNNFSENFTQDETYYILDTKENAKVYLGFQENIEKAAFKKALETSQSKNTPVEIDHFVQSHPAKKHDLFLIPNGTVHASGKNNLVLEISSTPYIFTFKMYDWMRKDLDGKPRPINIEHAFDNLYFRWKGKRIEEEFISRPEIIDSGNDWKIVHLPTHPNHYYDIERYEFRSEIVINTYNQCHVCMLVEGNSIILKTKNGTQQRFHYAETFVIPAAAESYSIINNGDEEAKVVKAFIKTNPNIKSNEINY